MKTRIVILCSLIAAIVLFATHQYSWATPKQEVSSPKIGIVSVRKVFQDSKRNSKYKEEATAEQDKVIAEIDKLQKEIEAEKAGIKTLKQGTTDHLNLARELLTKQATLQAKEEFHKQEFQLKDQRWTEDIYKEIIAKTAQVAEQKGLDLIFENDIPEFPAGSANELMLTIRTHKLLYSNTNSCVDITNDVIALIDAAPVEKTENAEKK